MLEPISNKFLRLYYRRESQVETARKSYIKFKKVVKEYSKIAASFNRNRIQNGSEGLQQLLWPPLRRHGPGLCLCCLLFLWHHPLQWPYQVRQKQCSALLISLLVEIDVKMLTLFRCKKTSLLNTWIITILFLDYYCNWSQLWGGKDYCCESNGTATFVHTDALIVIKYIFNL